MNIRIPDIENKVLFLGKLLIMKPRTLYLIKRVEIEATSRMAKALEKYGLTPIQFTVLYFVNDDPADLSSAQLSRRFSMTPQSMNELVAVLEKKKLLKKTTDLSHKRILRISLTAKGKKILTACNSMLDSLEEILLQKLSAAETNTLRNLIGKILISSKEMIS